MCGIAGYWGDGTLHTLEHMTDTLIHRGPDEGGTLIDNQVHLGHRRLSIIDLTPTGRQPMQSDDGSVSIIFNGEIYNYHELRTEFLGHHHFRGTSDTEVLLHLYQELGLSFLREIRGMFALAIYDRNKNTLLLARDHVGKKPLYWTKQGDVLVFGSELKALRAHPNCNPTMSATSVAQYLMYEYVPGPDTIYEGVHKLMPGTYLLYDGSTVTHGVYHSFVSEEGTYTGDFDTAQRELDTLLTRAVASRMVADVPVGVFLSGGLDSSTVAQYAKKYAGENLKTFSIAFTDSSYDESVYAREVARLLHTQHFERVVGPHDLEAVLTELPRVLDEPMADSSIVPTLLLSQFARSEVKVALGGDGADELFFGYGTFYAHALGRWYGKLPHSFQRTLSFYAHKLPVSHAYMSLDFKLKKFLSGFSTTETRRNAYWLSAFSPEELSSVLEETPETDTLLAPIDTLYRSKSLWDGLQEEYLKTYLVEDILVKTDRASMAYGLEVRAPFLDTDIVEFALTLPIAYKQRGRTGKYIIKKMMEDRLPKHILYRSKKGFNIPIGAWIQGSQRELFRAKLLEGSLVKSGLFKKKGLAILLEQHIQGRVDHRKKLWALFVLAVWMDTWQTRQLN